MKRIKRQRAAEFPKTIETFRAVSDYALTSLTQEKPDCFNSIVSVKRYRITVEEIEEPIDVLRERVRKLWRECDSYHSWQPLMTAAKELGIELSHDERRKK